MSGQGVSNCYVFKSRLQEYAQKVGIPTPVYETIKEGPSHEPYFKSTVIVNSVRYDSLAGFFNRKAAEQSAAEIALIELAKTGTLNQCISYPVHETGLCKNLLQEYAQKMNYAIPSYVCRKEETKGREGRGTYFSCTVEIGGITYIGAAAKTKKEAEIKAARTALLAIQSSPCGSDVPSTSMYAVMPCKRKGAVSTISTQQTASNLKPKKNKLKRKPEKRRPGKGSRQVDRVGNLVVNITDCKEQQSYQDNASGVQRADYELLNNEASRNLLDQKPSSFNGNEGQKSASEGALVLYNGVASTDGQLTPLDIYPCNVVAVDDGIASFCNGDGSTSFVGAVNTITGIEQVVNNPSSMCQGEMLRLKDGLN